MKLELAIFAIAMLAAGCPERGAALDDEEDAATAEVNCGEHGSAHGDHCHCHMGYLFDGEHCVAPDHITEVCADHTDDHVACVCPSEGVCYCSGEVVTLQGEDYCEPALHE